MTLGALWCPLERVKETNVQIRRIKSSYGFAPNFEIKWSKVSPSRLDFYLALIDYYFSNPALHFRGLVIPDKRILDHDRYQQDHNTWYYKMCFDLIKWILNPEHHYKIYMDIKDSRSAEKVQTLEQILRSSQLDYQETIVERLQMVHSHEIELLQLADLMIGVLSFRNRGLMENPDGSAAKKALVQRVIAQSGYSLDRTTLYMEQKFNVLIWSPRELV